MLLLAMLDPTGSAVEVERGTAPSRFGDGMGGAEEVGGTELGRERHGPGGHQAVQRAVVTVNRFLGQADGVVGLVDREVQRIGAIQNVPADDDAAARLTVGVEADLQVRSGARVNERGGPVFQQLGDGQEGRGVFVLGRHGGL